jgi:hypothetical protein
MFEMQDHLNNETCGKNWKDGTTNKDRKIDWNTCIFVECGELIDSLNWKHWKDINGTDDLDNAKVEVVDIWHFWMSEILRQNSNLSAIETAQKCNNFFKNKNIVFEQVDFNRDNLIESTKNLIVHGDTKYIVDMTNQLMDFDELYRQYIGKNVLNKFRQDNGYKDGTYLKLWNNKEDNTYVQAILKENSSISADELYSKLNEIYKAIFKRRK